MSPHASRRGDLEYPDMKVPRKSCLRSHFDCRYVLRVYNKRARRRGQCQGVVVGGASVGHHVRERNSRYNTDEDDEQNNYYYNFSHKYSLKTLIDCLLV